MYVMSNISAGVFMWVFVFQIEFYFGDANLQRDRFLGEKIKGHPEGCMYHAFTLHCSRELVFYLYNHCQVICFKKEFGLCSYTHKPKSSICDQDGTF